MRSYHLTAGPAKRFKCLSSGSSFPAQAATPRSLNLAECPPFLCERRCISPSGGTAGYCSTSTMCAAPSIAHPRGVPSAPSSSSGTAISANSDSLAVWSGPRSPTTSWNDGSAAATVRKTSVPPALPAITSGTRRRAAALGDRGVKSLAVRGCEPGGGEVLYGAELGGGVGAQMALPRMGARAIRRPGSSPARPSPAAPPRSDADPSP
jgi:hypothetical protein